MSEYNSTFLKFNGPSTLVHRYEHWSVLVRPKQVTAGSLVLINNGPQIAFSELPTAAFGELGVVTADIEATLSTVFNYDKINYLMLMMVDPHVHFHVIPRYENIVHFGTWELEDSGWPGVPDLGSGSADPGLVDAVLPRLRADWPSALRRT